jgi:hypothetical protein
MKQDTAGTPDLSPPRPHRFTPPLPRHSLKSIQRPTNLTYAYVFAGRDKQGLGNMDCFGAAEAPS